MRADVLLLWGGSSFKPTPSDRESKPIKGRADRRCSRSLRLTAMGRLQPYVPAAAATPERGPSAGVPGCSAHQPPERLLGTPKAPLLAAAVVVDARKQAMQLFYERVGNGSARLVMLR